MITRLSYQKSILSIVCFLSPLRNDCMLCAVFKSDGSSAYCLLALHLKLELATFSLASSTTRLLAALVGYLCLTPLDKA